MTDVLELSTGRVITYSLPPAKAVVAADEQFRANNWSTWSYDWSRARVTVGGRFWTCGDFSARNGGV